MMNAQVKDSFFPITFSLLFLLLAPLPQSLHSMKVPMVICSGMGAKTVYVDAASPLGKAHRKLCPLCLFFGNSPLCILVMKFMS